MSLLNAALRKKQKENQHPKIAAIFSESHTAPRNRRLWIYGLLACLALALGLAIFFGLHLLPSANNKTPLPSFSQMQTEQQKIEPAGTNPASEVEQVLPPPAPETILAKADPFPKWTPLPSEQAAKPSSKKKSTPKPIKTIEEKPKKGTKVTDDALPEPPKSNKLDPSRVFYEKAIHYHQQNRLREAIVLYQQVLRKNPLDTDTRFNLAAAYLQNRDFAMALSILRDLSEKDPNNPQILLNLAIAEMGLGEPGIALSLLDKAHQISAMPTFEFYFHKAIALSQLGRMDEAMRFYEMAAKIKPDNSSLWFNLGVLYDKMQRYKEALESYRAFLAQKGPLAEKEKEFVERRVLILSRFSE